MRILLALSVAAALSVPALAQEASPEGTWSDEFGTKIQFSLCGEGANQLCGVLLDIQGKSRTPENLAYVNKQVVQASPAAPNEWKGTVVFDGNEAAGTITQVAPDTLNIQGCRAAILCQTLAFQRV